MVPRGQTSLPWRPSLETGTDTRILSWGKFGSENYQKEVDEIHDDTRCPKVKRRILLRRESAQRVTMDIAMFCFGDFVNNLVNRIELNTSGRFMGIHPSFFKPRSGSPGDTPYVPGALG